MFPSDIRIYPRDMLRIYALAGNQTDTQSLPEYAALWVRNSAQSIPVSEPLISGICLS